MDKRGSLGKHNGIGAFRLVVISRPGGIEVLLPQGRGWLRVGETEIVGPAQNSSAEAAAELEELRRCCERYQRLLHNLPVGVFEADPAGDGKVLAANPAGLRLLGYESLAELQQLSTADLYVDPDERRDTFARIADSEGRPFQVVRHFRRKSGDSVRVSLILHQVNEGGRPRLFGVIQSLEERKQIEAELMLRNAAIHSSLSAIAIADLEGKITDANPAFLRMWKTGSVSDVVGKPVTEFWRSPDGAARAFDHLKRESTWSGELVGKRSNGEEFTAQVTSNVVKDEEGQVIGMMASFVDVTNLRKAEEERNRLLKTIEISCEAINITLPDGAITYTNRALDRLFGYARGELIGKHIAILNAPDFSPALVREIMASVEEKGHWEGEIRNRRKNGEEFVCYAMISALKDENGRTLNYLGAQHDITEHKKADEAREKYASRIEVLRQIDLAILQSRSIAQIATAALERLEPLIRCQRASIVAFDADGTRGTVIAVRSTKDTDVRVGTRLPVSLFDVLRADEGYECCVVDDIEELLQPTALDLQVLSEGIRCYMSAPLVAEGELIGALNLGAERPGAFDDWNRAVVREVADVLALAIRQHHLREQARRNTEELERAVAERTGQLESANAELEYLTASVVDELQVPLRAVMGLTREMLEWHVSKMGKEVKLLAGAVENAAISMKEHLDAIHEFTSIGQRVLEWREIDMDQVVKDTINQQAASLKERTIKLVVGELPPARGDLLLVKHLWRSLVDNALKFTRHKSKARVEIGAEQSGGETVYWVKDNGAGFDMSRADRLFGMFKRLHSLSDFPGLGVGLACAHRIVTRHGGRIWGQGEIDKGAEFRFTLSAR